MSATDKSVNLAPSGEIESTKKYMRLILECK